jgi:hypothetical protein
MDMVFLALSGGIEVSPSQQDALHDYLRRMVADYDARRYAFILRSVCGESEG